MELNRAILRFVLLQRKHPDRPILLEADTALIQWDTYRTLFSLMALHDPVRFSSIVRGLLNIQQHEGKLARLHGGTVQ